MHVLKSEDVIQKYNFSQIKLKSLASTLSKNEKFISTS